MGSWPDHPCYPVRFCSGLGILFAAGLVFLRRSTASFASVLWRSKNHLVGTVVELYGDAEADDVNELRGTLYQIPLVP